MHGFISHLHMQRLTVSIRIDRNCFDSHFAGSFDDAAGYFTAVGYQNFLKHRNSPFYSGSNASAKLAWIKFKSRISLAP